MTKEKTEVLFDYNAYQSLIDEIQKDEDKVELMDVLHDSMKTCCDYVSSVDAMELAMPRLTVNYEGADFCERVEQYDRARRIAHEAARASVSCFNRMAFTFGTASLYLGEMDDRYQIVDLCVDVVSIVFANRVV